jgi:hypothetical protein
MNGKNTTGSSISQELVGTRQMARCPLFQRLQRCTKVILVVEREKKEDEYCSSSTHKMISSLYGVDILLKYSKYCISSSSTLASSKSISSRGHRDHNDCCIDGTHPALEISANNKQKQ